MSFNVRQPDQDDGADAWEHRRELLVETVLEKYPDVIGTQELFQFQAEHILAGAPRYAWFGNGRFGDSRDKHVGIFYRKEALRPISHGDFWLSETPDVPGSSSWDIVRPRQVTWGRFELPDGTTFYHFNTHFPYRQVEQEVRRRTASLIQQRIAALPSDIPVIVTADFNSAAGGEIHRTLTGQFRDAWQAAAIRTGPEGTLNGFGRHASDRRIDWILYRAPWPVLEAETVTRNRGGRYPSDHYPVMAVFEPLSSTQNPRKNNFTFGSVGRVAPALVPTSVPTPRDACRAYSTRSEKR